MTPTLAAEQYADWVVDRVPGAREGHDAYLEAEAAARATGATVRERELELRDLRAENPHSHYIEDAIRAVAAATREHDPVAKAATRAYRAFQSKVNAGRDNAEVRQEAARRALSYHERASAALAELEATVDYIDAAWTLAGQPGRSWRANAFGDTGDAQRLALLALRQRLENFDVQRVTEAAAGEEVEHELHGDALARELAKSTTAIVLA